MQWKDIAGVSCDLDTGINRGLGVPPGTFYVALRYLSLEAQEARLKELIGKGVVVGEILPLHLYRSFFFDDPVNGLRVEHTNHIADYTEEDPPNEHPSFSRRRPFVKLIAKAAVITT